MIALYYASMSIVLVVLQTSVFPSLAVLRGFYDLLLPMMIGIALYRPMRYNLLFVLVVGFLVDSLTGGPFGLCLTTYFWMFSVIVWATSYLQVQGGLLLLFIVPLVVVFQNLVSIGVATLLLPGGDFPEQAYGRMASQVLWSLFTGPPLLAAFSRGAERWREWSAALFQDRSRDIY